MARISGVDLPREKRIEIGLTYVYGIGRVRASKILAEAEVNPDTRVKDLTDEEVARIAKVIDADTENLVEGDLRREVAMNIKRLKEIGCYRGIRHRKGLPCRGQKTKTNALTLIATISKRFLFVKPLLGIRLYNGIWPPSKPGLGAPERAF